MHQQKWGWQDLKHMIPPKVFETNENGLILKSCRIILTTPSNCVCCNCFGFHHYLFHYVPNHRTSIVCLTICFQLVYSLKSSNHHITRLLWEESICHMWILPTMSLWCGKHFHVMQKQKASEIAGTWWSLTFMYNLVSSPPPPKPYIQNTCGAY